MTPDPQPRSGRRARKRSNGEGTIARRADGRYTAAIYVTRPDGTRGRKWLYGQTRADVARQLTALAQRVETGAVIPTRSPTLSQYLDYWLTEVAGPKLRPTTFAKYRSTVELYLRPDLGSHRLERLSVATVQRYLNSRRAKGDSPQKLRIIREVLSSALGRATREELVGRNVAQLTTLPSQQRCRRTAWTAAQARTFLVATRDDPAHPFITLAMVYGMRRGEIAALHWEDIDFDLDRLAVTATLVRVAGQLIRGPVKTQSGVRTLPLVPLTRAAFLAQRAHQRQQKAAAGESWQDTGYVFTTRSGRPLEPRNASRSFDRLVAAAGLPKITFHDLRRTTATLLKDLGVPARDAQTILGHATVTVTLGIYSEVFDTEIASALGRMNDLLRGVEGNPNATDSSEH